MTGKITIYCTAICGDCAFVRRWFEQRELPFAWIDIHKDMDGAAFVQKVNDGNSSVPTIVFPDGDILVEPDLYELKMKVRAISDNSAQ